MRWSRTGRPPRSWGRSMLRECAAKQQIVDRRHVFSDHVMERDRRQLRLLAIASNALARGDFDAALLHNLLRDEDACLDECADRLGRATLGAGPELAGMALALAYLPFAIPDTFASLAFEPLVLRQVAKRLDPARELAPRTRLFLADRLMRNRTIEGLVAATGAAAALFENAGTGIARAGLTIGTERLSRLSDFATALADRPALFAAMLRACGEGDWQWADQLCRHVAGDSGHQGVDAIKPPWLADCLALTLLPTCDTIDAAARMLAVKAAAAGYQSIASTASEAAPDRASGCSEDASRAPVAPGT